MKRKYRVTWYEDDHGFSRKKSEIIEATNKAVATHIFLEELGLTVEEVK